RGEEPAGPGAADLGRRCRGRVVPAPSCRRAPVGGRGRRGGRTQGEPVRFRGVDARIFVSDPLKNDSTAPPPCPCSLCEHNRDGGSHRSPWSNAYHPLLDSRLRPPGRLRSLELRVNEVFDKYREQYYGKASLVSSVYLWETDDEGGGWDRGVAPGVCGVLLDPEPNRRGELLGRDQRRGRRRGVEGELSISAHHDHPVVDHALLLGAEENDHLGIPRATERAGALGRRRQQPHRQRREVRRRCQGGDAVRDGGAVRAPDKDRRRADQEGGAEGDGGAGAHEGAERGGVGDGREEGGVFESRGRRVMTSCMC
ncbi:hypothetical protein ACHAWF_017296, partial [Thalassiosira exigua]